MRVLGENIKNELKLNDNLSNSKLSLFYRMPTSSEINGYANGMVTRKGNKVVRSVGEMRQKYGAKILIGIGEGSFGKVVDGKTVPISSDPQSPNYDPQWQALVIKQAPDVIEILAIQVFEASISTDTTEVDEAEEGTDGDEAGE